ncbi:PqqD family peptide modification chaperone [Paenibacillus sp. L3-i20]|uniref:PqqD family peptide modification chaperone n=1 Tax=Paenibacillus sp. L3-i20 TaxID=2905833 RepID=UPI001EDFC40F|nr:PqqD family peptide modification chaperone [Paenibacillus sp. L3-i20]GKU75817.1 hypothetical protein L3i20_v202140 [Paenibacillus sp. L3-i20]
MLSNQEIIMPCELSMSLSTHLLIIRNKELLFSVSCDVTTIILIPSKGKCYELVNTGTRIWEMLQSPITVGQIVDTLLSEYDIDRMSCEAEVFSFLVQLSREKLIYFGI